MVASWKKLLLKAHKLKITSKKQQRYKQWNTFVKAHGAFLSLLLTCDESALLSVLLVGGRK